MGRIDARMVAGRLREVVADEPKAFAYEIGVSLSALYNYLNEDSLHRGVVPDRLLHRPADGVVSGCPIR